ncbi:MAG: hypothetical protein M0R39_09915 [Prolixibacteraceae bacterium]|jgi:hypothetical protein|nr:hypothetical protein [Prolixibacteraceae bacterium]
MLRLLLLLISTLYFGSLFGQMVSIHGQANDYAGKELIFYTYREPVSHQLHQLAKTTVEKDGTFALELSVAHSTEIYTDLEKYRGSLVVEPGRSYQISLPPYSPRTAQEAASPYFEPALYWLGIEGAKASDLNILVRAFLTDYNREIELHTVDLYQKKSQDTLKAIFSRLENRYPSGKFDYLNSLKKYSYGEIELAVDRQNKEQIAKKYFASTVIALDHPAFHHFFNAIFSDYLKNKSQDIRQIEFLKKALQGNFEGFVAQLSGAGYRKEVAELIAVKSFYDGYFSGKFDKPSMLKGLNEAATLSTFEPLKAVMPGILSKITSLQEGSIAPELMLRSQTEHSFKLRANGKFLYLAFFRSDSKESRAELDSLVSMNKKISGILTIVPVSLDKNMDDAVKLWSAKKYPWELIAPVHPDQAISDYRIKVVPTFYLISPDQKLLLSPALSPTHNFEALFLKVYRENRFMQQRTK